MIYSNILISNREQSAGYKTHICDAILAINSFQSTSPDRNLETGLMENKTQGKDCQGIEDHQVNAKNTCNGGKIRVKSQQVLKKCLVFLAEEMLASSANEIKVTALRSVLTEGFGLGGT